MGDQKEKTVKAAEVGHLELQSESALARYLERNGFQRPVEAAKTLLELGTAGEKIKLCLGVVTSPSRLVGKLGLDEEGIQEVVRAVRILTSLAE